MSISKVEEELVRIKEDFSQIPAVRTSKPEPVVPVKKRSRSGIIAAVAIIVILVLVLVYVLLL